MAPYWNFIANSAGNRSWLFDGVDERINSTATIDAILPAGFSDATGNTVITITVACEFKAVGTPGQYDTVLGAMNGFTWNRGFGMYFEDATTLRCWFRTYNAQKVDITVDPSVWNHVAMTYHYDSTAITGRHTIVTAWLNGRVVGEYASNSNFYDFLGTTNVFRVGADNDSSTYFSGYVRKVGIWSTLLTGDQVYDIYQKENDYLDTAPASLELYWKGHSSESVTSASGVLDLSGNGNHGTGSNMESGDLTTEVRESSDASEWTPANISGLMLWLDAQDNASLGGISNGSSVGSWTNKGNVGGAPNASQSTEARKPIYVTGAGPNGTNVVRFDGSAMGFGSPSSYAFLDTGRGHNYFIVMKLNEAASGSYYLNSHDETGTKAPTILQIHSDCFAFTSRSPWYPTMQASISPDSTNFHIFAHAYNGSGSGTLSNFHMYYDGTSLGPDASTHGDGYGNDTAIGFYDSAGNPGGPKFDIIEYLFFNSELSADDRASVIAWIRARYGI